MGDEGRFKTTCEHAPAAAVCLTQIGYIFVMRLREKEWLDKRSTSTTPISDSGRTRAPYACDNLMGTVQWVRPLNIREAQFDDPAAFASQRAIDRLQNREHHNILNVCTHASDLPLRACQREACLADRAACNLVSIDDAWQDPSEADSACEDL